MQRYYILLKATGESGLPAWLPYRLTATSAELAVEKAKRWQKITTESTRRLKFRQSKMKGVTNETGGNRKTYQG